MKFPALGILGAALASCAPTPGKKTFDALDANHDRRVTSAEFHAHVTREGFRKLDADGDGRVTKQEWQAKEKDPASQKLFAVFDTNKDGSVTPAEFTESRKKREHIDRIFETVDRNQDGALEWSEIHTAS